MRSLNHTFVRALFLVLLALSGLDAQTFARNDESSAVRLSYTDLAAILARVRELIKSSNASFAPKYQTPIEYLDVGNGHSNVELTQDMSVAQLASAPEIAYSIQYVYRFSDAPISSVRIDLSDYRREVAVGGQSRTDVDALSNLVLTDLNAHGVTFAGPGFRTTASMMLSMVACTLIMFALFMASPKRAKVLIACLGFAILAVLYFMPWSEWLAGTTIYAGDSSFLKRNAPLLTLLGVVVPLIGMGAAMVRWFVKHFRYATQAANDSLHESRNDNAHLM